MNPRLVAISGPFEGQIFEIEADRFVIGRHSDCDLCLSAIEISRRHCEIVRRAADRAATDSGASLAMPSFVLRDFGSRHGTRVNGKAIEENVLAHSDLIALGTSAFLFMLDDSSADRQAGDGPTSVLGSDAELLGTQTLHLDPARVDAALPAQARLARELHILLRLSTGLQEEEGVPALASRLLDATLEAIPAAERGAVLLREPGLPQPVPVAERGLPLGRLGKTVLERVLDQGKAICCPRVADDGELGGAPSLAEVGALVAAPLITADGEALGLIYVDSQKGGFEAHHLELVSAISGVASVAVQNALHLRWLEGENQRLRSEEEARHDMIGESPAIRKVLDLVSRVARADSTVLVHGESGTGKELVARAIHRSSPRREGPFIAVNCATLSENLFESALFGHEKGAFTGALARKMGKMEAAHRGTLFLDEVAEIPVSVQAKLLRALQEREIERVGGLQPIAIDVRVVAATHRDLKQAVRDGDFREDLYFRLGVITCDLPPLRERREDIPLLARHFARHHAEKLGLPELGIAPDTRRCLLAYDWPGNIRELGNIIERAVVLGDGEVVRREDLPDEVASRATTDALESSPASTPSDLGSGGHGDFQGALVAFKKQLILDAWRASGEDYARTAEALGIHTNSLHRLVKNLDLKTDLGR